ncbi:MAG: hypothetical protein V3U02_10725 [Calditrichia bacterium]
MAIEKQSELTKEDYFRALNSPLVYIGAIGIGLYFLGKKIKPLLDNALNIAAISSDAIVDGVNDASQPLNSVLALESLVEIDKEELLRTSWNFSHCTNQKILDILPFNFWLDNQPKITVAFINHKKRLIKFIAEEVHPKLLRLVDIDDLIWFNSTRNELIALYALADKHNMPLKLKAPNECVELPPPSTEFYEVGVPH